MPRYRNSQKRIYIPGAVYFCTTNTYMRYPWFEEPLLREVLAAEINKCQFMHNFDLHGYAIMPDHMHIMFMPGEGSTHSDIMKSLKKQSSHNMNRILGGVPMRYCRGNSKNALFQLEYADLLVKHDVFIRKTRKKYIEKHGATSPPIRFKWHKSYHDHYIRAAEDFINHLRYIEKQPAHHGVEGVVYVDAQKYEGEKALSRLRIFETGNRHTHKTGQNSRIELIARAVGDDVHVSRF